MSFRTLPGVAGLRFFCLCLVPNGALWGGGGAMVELFFGSLGLRCLSLAAGWGGECWWVEEEWSDGPLCTYWGPRRRLPHSTISSIIRGNSDIVRVHKLHNNLISTLKDLSETRSLNLWWVLNMENHSFEGMELVKLLCTCPNGQFSTSSPTWWYSLVILFIVHDIID